MRTAILFTLIFTSLGLAQGTIPGIVGPSTSNDPVVITEYADHTKAKVISVQRFDGATGVKIYDSKTPVKLTAEQYHKLAAAGYWSWTKKQSYHAAVCTVQNRGSRGTGALIWKSSDSTYGVVATAAHVLARGSGTIRWQSGKTSACEGIAVDGAADGSLLLVRGVPAGIPVIPVSRETPPSGSFVEHCGFGGPGLNLRHFWATWRGPAPTGVRRSLTNCYLLNGDSGGPVIYKGKLVGMNSGGYNTRDVGIGGPNRNSRWPLHSPAIIAGPGSLRGMVNSLMGRTEAKTCDLFNRTQWGQRIFGGRRSQPQRRPSPQYFPEPQPDPQGSPDGFDPYVPSPNGQQGPPPPADDVEDEECRKRVDALESGLAEAKTQMSEVKQIAESNKLLGEGNANRLDEIGASLAGIKEQLNSMQENMQSGLTINQELTTIVNNNQVAIDEIRARLDQLAQAQATPPKVEPPTTDPANPPQGASKDLLLYYTAAGLSGVKAVDDKIDELRDKGYPIIVTTLSPRDTKIQGVPRIYIVKERRQVDGVKNCLVYLSNLVR